MYTAFEIFEIFCFCESENEVFKASQILKNILQDEKISEDDNRKKSLLLFSNMRLREIYNNE